MKPYVYKSLDKGEIRLLKLHPQGSGQQLSGSLIHVSLTNPIYCPATADSEAHLEHPYPYEAISYTWGADTRKPFSLIIDQHQTIGVTAHVHYILQKIMQPDVSVHVWIDAICINQADRDSEEKSQQIRLMPDIYRIAKRVQIHLGPEANDSPLAIRFMEHMAEYSEYLDESLNIKNSEAYALALEMGYSPPASGDRTWNALRSFWLRPWFRRIWVAQELINALDLVIYCEDLEIDWRNLWLAARVFQNNARLMETGLTMFTYHVGVDALEGANSYYNIADMRLRAWGYMSPSYMISAWAIGEDKHTPAGLLGERGLRPHEKYPIRRDLPALQAYESLTRPNALRDHAAGNAKLNFSSPELLDMLYMTRDFLATNPVDRIYALLGIVRDVDPDDADFRIEYAAEQTPAIVCQRFAAGLIKRGQGAAVLGIAGTTRQACRTVSDSPSWVPNWTTPIRPNDYVISMNYMMHGLSDSENRYGASYCAAGRSRMEARFGNEDSTLVVRGVRVDTLLHITQGQLFAPPNWYLSILLAFAGPGADPARVEEALWRTLLANRTSKGEEASPELAVQYQAYKHRTFMGLGLACIAAGILFVLFLPFVIFGLRWLGLVHLAMLYTPIFFMGWDTSPLPTIVAVVLLRNYSIPVVLIGCCILIWRAKELATAYLIGVEIGWQYLAGLVMAYNPRGPRYHKGPPECADFMQSFLTLAGRHNLGITAAGFIGLFPLAAKAGDKVVILEGGFTPFTLRPIGESTAYTLIGESYVHGIMKGELWEDAGPYLEDIRLV